MTREIVFYETASGSCPVEEFLDSLSAKQAKKTTWVLRLIEELPTIPSSYLKKLVNTDEYNKGSSPLLTFVSSYGIANLLCLDHCA